MNKNEEAQYYSRQEKLIGTDGQVNLKAAKVLIIGAGGLGCPVLIYLASMGVGHLGIVDHDKVELTNLHRQILYTPNDLGEFKSKVAALKIKENNPHITIHYFTNKIDDENVSEFINDFDIIVDCTDNFKTKFLIHDHCFIQKKKLVQSSLYQFEGNLHVFDFSLNQDLENSPCLRCLWTKEPEDGVVGTCEEVGILGVTAGVFGSLQAMEVAKLILGKSTLKNGEGLFVDLLSEEFEKRTWKKNKTCSLCSQSSMLQTTHNSLENFKIKKENINDKFIWVDLRSLEDDQGIILNHHSVLKIPISEFAVSKLNLKSQYLLICQKGYRSNQLLRVLHEEGYTNFYSLVDGILNFKN